MSRLTSFLLVSFTVLGLLACSAEDKREAIIHRAVAIEQGEECHLCGMIINNFTGPKGEIFDKPLNAKSVPVKKFCSTRDLFSYLLQPENRRQAQAVFVHNMAKVPWEQPDDQAFIPAEQAWYVAGHSRQAAMGPTLASFELQSDAELFQQQYGGEVLAFDHITLDLLISLPSDN